MMNPYPPEYDLEYDEDVEETFEVGGIDDCEYLFSASDDNENTVYVCIDKNPDNEKYYATGIIDCGTGHFVESICENEGSFESVEEAFWGVSGCFDWFVNNDIAEYEYCEESKKMLTTTTQPTN